MPNTFKVYERLKREQQTDTLFHTGKAYSVFPVRTIYLIVERKPDQRSPVLTGFSVPKKKITHAVDRHRVRRQMVEAWRLNKQPLYDAIPKDKQILLFFLYMDNKLADYATITTALITNIDKLKQLF